MQSREMLVASENSASANSQHVSHVVGKKFTGKSSKKMKSLGAMGFLTAIIVVAAVMFGLGEFIPTNLYENLVEQTDVQYADAVESKKIIIKQALVEGYIPDDTAEILEEKGISVGYMENGEFVKSNKAGGNLVLKKGNEIITADNFIEKINSDVALYNAINEATYGRAAYYYDETANDVFKKIGTSRNNYTDSDDLGEVMNSIMGSGSNIDINSVSLVQKTRENEETGETETYYEYEGDGKNANSKSGAGIFINEVASKNYASNTNDATLNSAGTLNVADTISKEQRSSLFYTLFMENVSKMKFGDGNESKINEAMNYLYDKTETEVVDIKTGEVKKVTGTALDSPSLYAVMSGNKVNVEEVNNYSSDRVLKTIENKVGKSSNEAITGTVTSSTNNTKGSIGRFISESVEGASGAILSLVEPTISGSMINNSYDDIKGVGAGETLVEGAVNVGKMLAKGSGATGGDAEAVVNYARLNSAVLAMDAKVDRDNRNPFDITSKNTFLGSIIYKFAMASLKFGGVFTGIRTFSTTLSSAISNIITPSLYADEADGYLATFGECETYATIGAVGTAQCSEIATFDTSTLNDPFNDAGFIDFINNNTTLDDSGTRKINNDSVLAKFILYNDNRESPLGVVDGGILNSLNDNSNSIPFLSDIVGMVELFDNASKENKKIASGEAFVNSSKNSDWQTYKYAQRYVSLARAMSALKQYSNDKTAYKNLEFFEGELNPVTAFIEQYNNLANN